jgi:hypothetical protein
VCGKNNARDKIMKDEHSIDKDKKLVKEFLDKHGNKTRYKYKSFYNNFDDIEKNIVCKYLDEAAKQKKVLYENDKEIGNFSIDTDIGKLDMMYRIFHHITIESREVSKIVNCIDRFIEILGIKQYLFEQIINTLENMKINKDNIHEIDYLVRLLLNDVTFYNIYLWENEWAMEILKNIIFELEDTKNNLHNLDDGNGDSDDIEIDDGDHIEGYGFV